MDWGNLAYLEEQDDLIFKGVLPDISKVLEEIKIRLWSWLSVKE